MSLVALTGYGAELQSIEDDIRTLGPDTLNPPIDVQDATKYAYRLYQRVSLNGDLNELPAAERAIDVVISELRRPDDLLVLKANLCFKLHRLDAVDQILTAHPHLRETREGLKLEADLHFQKGRYAQAREAYVQAIATERSWDNLARYAHFAGKFDGAAAADRLYVEAEDELTSKQMRSFAWVELQRGVLDLQHGRLEAAEAHYVIAERAYPGYWMVDEHRAALVARQGPLEGALELYLDLAGRVRKPELLQAVGELYRQLGEPDRAATYLDRVLVAYEESAARGEVHYYHHLVDFHCEVTRNTKEAVRWAREDVALRSNFSTKSALAWALHLDGASAEAVDWVEQALRCGVIDERLFSHAAVIYAGAGQHERSRYFSRQARKVNPWGGGFHTHYHCC